MKYRLIKTSDEITVLMEDGGVACIRYADEIDEGDCRTAVTDYYGTRLTHELIDEGGVWEELSEGKMYCKDWYKTDFDNPELVQDALEWLCFGEEDFEIDNTIWKGF